MTVYAGDITYAADLNAFVATSGTAVADSATITTTETTVVTVTAPLIAGRTYEITSYGCFSSTVAADAAITRIRLTSSSGTQLCGGQVYIGTTSTVGFSNGLRAEYSPASSGDQVFVLTVVRNTGTGNIKLEAGTTQPAWLAVRLMN